MSLICSHARAWRALAFSSRLFRAIRRAVREEIDRERDRSARSARLRSLVEDVDISGTGGGLGSHSAGARPEKERLEGKTIRETVWKKTRSEKALWKFSKS